MIKGIIAFLALWAFVTGAIGLWRTSSGREKINVINCAIFGFLTAILAFAILIGIVVLF